MTSKLVSKLALSIYDNSKFKNDFKDLIIEKFSANKGVQLSELQIKKLLETASIFALNEDKDGIYQRLAFKISIFLLEIYRNNYPALPFVVQLILSRLGDLPTIRHMIERNDGKDLFSYFNGSDEDSIEHIQFPEILSTKTFNQIQIGNTEQNLTDFQTKIFYGLKENENISFSAPTSAGKSFIIHQYIAERILSSTFFYCVVYLAPTRSLIKEVQDSIAINLRKFGITTKDVLIFSSVSPMNIKKVTNVRKKILVMTQERLQQMISSDTKFTVDLLVVDEAQKISEEDRGVIIEDAVQELIDLNPSMQKVFISPNIKDPEKFQKIFKIKEKFRPYKTFKTPVGQNIFDVRFSKEESKVYVSLNSQELDEQFDLYTKSIQGSFNYHLISTRKAWVVNNILKRQDPTIVYCDTRVDCRTVCKYILKDVQSFEPFEELKEAIDFIKTHVHKYYFLLDHLKNGVGYHYGKMPQFVRLKVKELYENKKIDTLCCTSTLIEGVNLPAKNVVLYNPKLGRDILMDTSGVRNIAGRAGRLAKDYYGDIYCIDRKDWENDEVFEGELEPIQSAIEKTLSNKMTQVLDYLDVSIVNDENKSARRVATTLMIRFLKDAKNFDDYLKTKHPQISKDDLLIINEQLTKIANTIQSLETTVILKNRDIDPRFQHELYEFLKKPGNLVLPPFPWDENFYGDLLLIFESIAKILFRETHKSYIYYTNLASRWIKGRPYKEILDNKIRINKINENESEKAFVNRMIDKLDDELENYLKYHYSRGLQCYCDMAAHILKERKEDVSFCIELPEYLEAGASDPRIFLLLDAGLTRVSALYLFSHLDPEIKEVADCIEWFKNKKDNLKEWLPESLIYEVELLLK